MAYTKRVNPAGAGIIVESLPNPSEGKIGGTDVIAWRRRTFTVDVNPGYSFNPPDNIRWRYTLRHYYTNGTPPSDVEYTSESLTCGGSWIYTYYVFTWDSDFQPTHWYELVEINAYLKDEGGGGGGGGGGGDTGTYWVTFDFQGGGGGTAGVYATRGELMPTPITPPKRKGYKFDGYGRQGVTYYNADCTSDHYFEGVSGLIIFARWIAESYTVELDQQGGAGGTTEITATFDQSMPAITMPRKEGMGFFGYFTEPDGGGTKYYNADGSSARNWDIAADTTLYACWRAGNLVTLSFLPIGRGGDTYVFAVPNQPMPQARMPYPYQYYAVFRGYFTEPDGGGTKYYNADGSSARNWDLGVDTTLYAFWPRTVSIWLDNTIGTGGTYIVECVLGEPMPPITLPTHPLYEFVGYFSSMHGGGVKYYNANGSSARDWDFAAGTTLYAAWRGKNLLRHSSGQELLLCPDASLVYGGDTR